MGNCGAVNRPAASGGRGAGAPHLAIVPPGEAPGVHPSADDAPVNPAATATTGGGGWMPGGGTDTAAAWTGAAAAGGPAPGCGGMSMHVPWPPPMAAIGVDIGDVIAGISATRGPLGCCFASPMVATLAGLVAAPFAAGGP